MEIYRQICGDTRNHLWDKTFAPMHVQLDTQIEHRIWEQIRIEFVQHFDQVRATYPIAEELRELINQKETYERYSRKTDQV
jgi:hypothetical protein